MTCARSTKKKRRTNLANPKKGQNEDFYKKLERLVKKYPIYSFEYNEKEYAEYVKTPLADHEKTLAKFRIEGATKSNYKDFLKKKEPIKNK